MNKTIKQIVAALCLVCMMLPLAACTDKAKESNEAEQYHTVSFNTHGGSPVASVKVKHNSHCHAPEIPTKNNSIFRQWTYNNEVWVFDAKKITQDITLDANWINAEEFFEIEPYGDGIGIADINQQKDFEKLTVPGIINNLPVVAVLDYGCELITDQYAHVIVFPESLTYIGAYGFKKSSGALLEFTGSITYLGESAFEDCTTVETIGLGNGLEVIPMRAFIRATALKTIDIPDTTHTIQENAFEGCSSLLTVVFPVSLTTIEDSAFLESAVKTIFYDGTEEQFDKIDIAANGNDAILDAKVYYYSETEPQTEGNYWHYGSKGTPVTW